MAKLTPRHRGYLRIAALLAAAAVILSAPVGSVSAASSPGPSPSTGPSQTPVPSPTATPQTNATATPAPPSSPAPSGTPGPTIGGPSANPTVTSPGPLPSNAPKPGVAPTAGGSRLGRAIAAASVAAPASLLPASTCSLSGTTRTCELWATTGSLTLPAQGSPPAPLTLPVWGFSTTSNANTAQVPGPLLVANTGETIQFTVHNALPTTANVPNNLSLVIPASGLAPDTTGVAPGSQASYNFGSLQPGTYLYEAGPTGFGARQVRMGLSGLLIVRPSNYTACNCAYGNTANDGFVDEATVQLNEFDPAFNNDPFGMDPIDFSPSEFTINGAAFDPANPTAGKINVANGDVLLVHYANLTDHERGISIANERQRILADDSRVRTNPLDVATKWLNPGQVSDSFVTVDPSFPLNTHVPIYDAGFHFNNGDGNGLGGMFTYLDVVQSLAGNPAGPVTTATVSPVTNNGQQDVTVSGTITPSTGATLQDAEWFLDDPLAGGSAPAGQHFTVSGNSYSFTIPAATLNTLLLSSVNRDGDHIIWVHGKDSSGTPPGTWGVVSGDVFSYNATGPVIGGVSLHSSPTNGGRPTDVANGGGLVVGGVAQNQPNSDLVILGQAGASLSNYTLTAAEYCLDSTTCAPGHGIPLVVTPTGSDASGQQIDSNGSALTTPTSCVPVPSPPGVPPPSIPPAPGGGSVVSFCGRVAASDLLALPQGLHTLYLHACEQIQTSTGGCNQQTPARWGGYAQPGSVIPFVIDKHGPDATVSLSPNPNNGKQGGAGNLNFLDSLQVTAGLTDPIDAGVNSNIAYGEVFLSCSPATQSSCPSTTGPIDPATGAAPANGSGAEMVPQGGAWDAPAKTAYAYIPLAELTAYPEGKVRFWVHAQDLAGNWGGWAYADLTLDRTPPVFDTPALPVPPAPPTSQACTAGCTVSFTAHDPVSGGVNSNITQGEWFIDSGAHLICEVNVPGCAPEVVAPSDPGYGQATAIPIGTPGTSVSASVIVPAQPAGTHIVFRVKDAAGNWSLDNLVVTQ